MPGLPLTNYFQISRLYRPLDTDYDSDNEDQQLLPSHYVPTDADDSQSRPKPKPLNHNNLSDVWDEREELFEVGDESDEEPDSADANAAAASVERGRIATPKITITAA